MGSEVRFLTYRDGCGGDGGMDVGGRGQVAHLVRDRRLAKAATRDFDLVDVLVHELGPGHKHHVAEGGDLFVLNRD